MGNDVDLWEMAKICGKWLKYLTNGLITVCIVITRPVIIEYTYNEGNLWVPNAPVLYNH